MDTTITKKRDLSWIMHILICIMVLALPFIFNPRRSIFSFTDYLGFCIPMILYIAVFYTNFYYLIKKFLFQKRVGIFILSNIILIALVSFILYRWNDFYFTKFVLPNINHDINYEINPEHMRRIPYFSIIFRDVMFMIMVIFISLACRSTIEWYHMDREKAKIQAFASQAELKNLKSQLNPHFLFNSLNNIYSLMRIDTVKAQNAILELSKILRYVLNDENQDRVLLRDDVSFMKNYIELMSLRLGKNATLTSEIADFSSNGSHIAPLLFISLVENAFKHGISQTDPSFIDVKIHLTDDGKMVALAVRNSYFPKAANDYSGSGIGVENLKKRLSLLYPGKHTLTSSIKEGVYSAELKVELD